MSHKYIYTNYSEPSDRCYNGLPKGILAEIEAPDMLAADKEFTRRFGFKFSDSEASLIITWCPDWRSGGGTGT